MANFGGANRIELESQILCAALRQSWQDTDATGMVKACQELSNVFPDLLPPPCEQLNNPNNYYEVLGIDCDVNPPRIIAAYFKAVRKFLKENPKPRSQRNEYYRLLNAGFLLRKPRSRLSHDLIVVRKALVDNHIIPEDGTLEMIQVSTGVTPVEVAPIVLEQEAQVEAFEQDDAAIAFEQEAQQLEYAEQGYAQQEQAYPEQDLAQQEYTTLEYTEELEYIEEEQYTEEQQPYTAEEQPAEPQQYTAEQQQYTGEEEYTEEEEYSEEEAYTEGEVYTEEEEEEEAYIEEDYTEDAYIEEQQSTAEQPHTAEQENSEEDYYSEENDQDLEASELGAEPLYAAPTADQISPETELKKEPEAPVETQEADALPILIELLIEAQLVGPLEVKALTNQMKLYPDISLTELIMHSGYVAREEMKSLLLAEFIILSGKISMKQFKVILSEKRTWMTLYLPPDN